MTLVNIICIGALSVLGVGGMAFSRKQAKTTHPSDRLSR